MSVEAVREISIPSRQRWVLPVVAVLLVIVFAGLVVAFRDGVTTDFDRAVLLSLRDPADLRRLLGPRWLPEFARDLTGLGSTMVVYLFTAIVLAFLALSRKWADFALVVVAIGGGQFLSSSVKHLVARARPDLIPGAPQTFTASFPSGHALLSAVIYLTLGAILSRLEPRRPLQVFYIAVAMLLTLIIGVSRVALGVHWPTDVLAGWSIGIAWAILCAAMAEELARRRAVEPLG